MTHWRSVHTYFFFYVRYTSQVQMSPQTFCRGNNWIYVCAFDAALIFTTFMHNVYKICGTFPLFHVCCSPIVSKVLKQKSIFFSKFQENWSFRNIGAKWTKIWQWKEYFIESVRDMFGDNRLNVKKKGLSILSCVLYRHARYSYVFLYILIIII